MWLHAEINHARCHILCLVLCALCSRRKKKQREAKANKPVLPVPPNGHLDKSHDPPGLPPPPEFLMNENESVVMENEYAYIEEMPPPPPSPSPPPPAPPLSAPPYPIPSSPKPPNQKASSRDPLMMSHDQLHIRDTCSATSSPRHVVTAFPFPPPLNEALANPSFMSSPAHHGEVLANPSFISSPAHRGHSRHNSQSDSISANCSHDNATSRYGAIRVKEVAPYSIRTCHGLQHPDANGNPPNFSTSPRPQRTPVCNSPANGNSPYKVRNCDTLSHTYSEVPYFEVEPDAIPRDAVPYEYGYSCQTGEKFTVYHAKSVGKHFKTANKKKNKFITKKKSKTGTMWYCTIGDTYSAVTRTKSQCYCKNCVIMHARSRDCCNGYQPATLATHWSHNC